MKRIYLLIVCLIAIFNSYIEGQESLSLTKPGAFVVGCNYWASHAGLSMWRDWRPDIVETDLKQLSEGNIEVIRVFPIWPDFQPIVQFYGGGGKLLEIRFKDKPLPDKGIESNGVSIEALKHFRMLADLADKYHIKLIVGLVTGWMSGQLLVPTAIEGRNVLSDPVSLMWQIRFVRTFVREFKDHPAILAWDLGNECNVMEGVDNQEAAYLWTASIANTIRSEDKTRPVVSGMHGLSAADNGIWRIKDQGELTDVLTTHPYAVFTPYAGQDIRNSMRTTMHSAAESRLYADVANKPCIAEEIGMLGPMEANETVTAAFARTAMFSLWANDCHGFLWWCAYDLNHLQFPPYEWNAIERDLGLFRVDRTAKPVMQELRNFSGFLHQLPFRELPVRKTNAVCILTEGQDQWAVAYSSYILAKQAGLEIVFQHVNQELKESDIYLLPSINGMALITRQKWLELLERVKQGAVLYVSCDEGFISPFNEPLGIDVTSRQVRTGKATFTSLDDKAFQFELSSANRFNIKPTSAKVLAMEKDNNPIFMVNQFGNGKIYFLTIPLESSLTNTPEAFHESSAPCWKIYKTITEGIAIHRTIVKDNPFIGLTEHDLSPAEKIVIVINYSVIQQDVKFQIDKNWQIAEAFYGNAPVQNKCTINANNALVFKLIKKQ
jgi:endo-1,4-beta-mannosidase